MVLGEAARLLEGGVVAGLLIAWLGASLLKGFVFSVSVRDPLTYLAVPVLFAAVGAVAAYLPARRATRGSPTEVMRGECGGAGPGRHSAPPLPAGRHSRAAGAPGGAPGPRSPGCPPPDRPPRSGRGRHRGAEDRSRRRSVPASAAPRRSCPRGGDRSSRRRRNPPPAPRGSARIAPRPAAAGG